MYDYSRFVAKVRENSKTGLDERESIDKAVNEAIKENLLDGFFVRQKAEVIKMILTEFDEELFKQNVREDGYEEGWADGKQEKAIEATENLLHMNVLSFEQIAQATSLPLEKVREIAQSISSESLSVHS